MNASTEAYEWLERKDAGLYEGLVASVLSMGATLVQDAEFVLAYKVEEGEAHVLFAYGNLRKIIKFAHANAGIWGVERVLWERSLCGKHKKINVYNLNKLRICKKERDLT